MKTQITMETPLKIRVNRLAVLSTPDDKDAVVSRVELFKAVEDIDDVKPEQQVDAWIRAQAARCTPGVEELFPKLREGVYRYAEQNRRDKNGRKKGLSAAQVYHGDHSKNWQEETRTAREVLSLLRSGFGVAPAQFRPDPGKAKATGDRKYLSCRSDLTFTKTALLLLDGDEWSDVCPAPASVEDLLARFPTMSEDFCFLSESLSSRTEKKPELRFRCGVLLPDYLTGSEVERRAFVVLVGWLCERYPFVAKGVGKDISRLGFGNARRGAIYKELPGRILPERLAWAREKAEQLIKAKAREAVEKEERAAAARAARLQNAKRTGTSISEDGYESDDPLAAFRATPIRDLLVDIGCTETPNTRGGARWWHYPGATNAESFLLFENGGMQIYSNTMQDELPPGADPRMNGHRFVCYYQFGFDFLNARGQERVRLLRALAAAGYGQFKEKPPRTGPRRRVSRWEVDPNGPKKIREEDLPAIQVLRDEIPEVFRNWMGADAGGKKRFLLISYDTGAGKSYTMILNSDELLMISPHWELAAGNAKVSEEKALGLVMKPEDLERYRFLWQGKTAGWRAAALDLGFDPDGEIKTDLKTRRRFLSRFGKVQSDGRTLQCAFGDLVNRYHRNGYEFGTSFCPNCPFREECQQKGYHSQRGRAAKANHVHIAWADVVFDPALKTFAGLSKSKTLAVVDDLPITEMTIRRAVSLPELDRLISERSEDWVSDTDFDFKPDTGEQGGTLSFLKRLRWLLTTDGGPGDVKGALDAFQKKTLETARRELARIPFYYSFDDDGIRDHKGKRTLSKEEFPELHEWLLKREQTREDAGLSFLKKMQKVNLTPARALRLGVVDHGNLPAVVDPARGVVNALLDATARVRKVLKTDGARGLELSVKPTLNFQNTVLLSATANAEQVQGMLREGVDFSHEKGPAARWREGCRVLQINTGLYTGESFFKKPNGAAVSGPGPRLKDVVNAVLKEVRADRKVLLVGRKALTSEAVTSVLSPILEHPKVALLNYGAIDGLNDFSDFDTAFLMLPFPDRRELEDRAWAVHREDFDDLDFEKRENVKVSGAGLTMSMTSYSDERVRELALFLMQEQIYQAAMRLRPNLNPDKSIVILTALPIPGLTDRESTIAISFDDLLSVREVRELSFLNLPGATVTADLENGKTVNEIASARGVSERAVRNATRELRAVEKRERDNEIKKRGRAGESIRAIASAMGVSVGTVQDVLKTERVSEKARRDSEIRARRDAGQSIRAIASEMGSSEGAVKAVLKNSPTKPNTRVG